MKSTPKKRVFPAAVPGGHLPVDVTLFAPGDRVSIAVSGGADSTALLRTLVAQRAELGIVLSVVHVEHGLRGEAAARDAAFVAALAEEFSLPCEVIAVDTPARAAEHKESVEEAARNLRYQVFRDVLASGNADTIATAHTLDDQAETVLMKLLRGAWTEGLSGIHPVLRLDGTGVCVRPLLQVTRSQIDIYLRALDQPWCEDETNRSLVHTRNRVRHELLPVLREYNPQVEQMLAHIADNARAEEQHWQAELARVLPQILLPGKPVRGGGRSVATAAGSVSVAMEIARLQALDAGLRRRVLRAAAERCGATLDFDATESLLGLAAAKSHAAKRLELSGGVRVERSARELQFERTPLKAAGKGIAKGSAIVAEYELPIQYSLPIPGTVEAPAFRARYTATFEGKGESGPSQNSTFAAACVRSWQPGDRVELAHSSGPKKVKEVLERMGVRGEERILWPVVVWQGEIVWMRGVRLQAESAGSQTVRENGAIPAARLRIEEIRL